MTNVGFIGLGTMGSGFARCLLAADNEISVFDIDITLKDEFVAGGARWCENPREVAQASDVIFTSLPGPPEVEATVYGPDGLLAGISAGKTYFDLTTNSPTLVRRVNQSFAEADAYMLDSPVSGRASNSALWVGGDEAIFRKYEDLLCQIGNKDRIDYLGPSGCGSIVKLVHNLSGYAVNAVLAETITLGVKAGMDPLALWAAVRNGANGRARTFDQISGHFLQNRYDPPNFKLRLAHKDVSLATALGKELGIPMRLSNLTLEDMTEAMGRGWSEKDSRIALSLQAERAGVHIEEDAAKIREIREQG